MPSIESARRLRGAAFLIATLTACTFAAPAAADEAKVKRGEYLTTLGGCLDCHTPGYFLGQPDWEHRLSGSEVGFEIPGLGVFHGPNLTPDPETGLGNWTEDDIVKALRTGERPDGRMLAPIMPYENLKALTDDDAYAIAAFLKSLPPTVNKVPGPFGPDEKPTAFVMRVHPPAE